MASAPKPLLLLLGALLLSRISAPASEWDPKMDPPLGLSFPIETTNGRVAVSQDLLIAADKVLPAGTVLRTVFRPATIAEGEEKNRRGIDEAAFSRDIPKVTTKGLMTETERKMLQRAYETVWTDPIEFRRGFETAAPANLRIVLEPPHPPSNPSISLTGSASSPEQMRSASSPCSRGDGGKNPLFVVVTFFWKWPVSPSAPR
jgi:hypothetical protein